MRFLRQDFDTLVFRAVTLFPAIFNSSCCAVPNFSLTDFTLFSRGYKILG